MSMDKSQEQKNNKLSDLVMLFGMPRSGTTWVGKILDSSPVIEYKHEPDTESPLMDVPLIVESNQIDKYADRMASFSEQVLFSNSLRISSKQPLFEKSWRGNLLTKLLRMNILAAKITGRSGINLPLIFSKWPQPEPERTVWKSIESLGRMGVLRKILPDSKRIVLIRHPCGHVASVLRGERKKVFSSDVRTEHDIGILEILANSSIGKQNDLSIDSLQQMQAEEVLAWRWRIMNDHALIQVQNDPQTMVVNYDKLCQEPIAIAQQIFQHIGLDMQQQSIEFIRPKSVKQDDAYYSVNKYPLIAANKWKDELDKNVIDRVLAIISPALAGELFE